MPGDMSVVCADTRKNGSYICIGLLKEAELDCEPKFGPYCHRGVYHWHRVKGRRKIIVRGGGGEHVPIPLPL